MDKPRNYDYIKPFGEFEPLKPGGHVCRIMKVEEALSKSGREMIIVYLDIAEGEQKNYYKNMYESDKRENKKWGCAVYQLVYDQNGDAGRGFKTFNTSVEESNPGFSIMWGTQYCESLKGKFIGGIFGREQYKKQNGELAWNVKCFGFRSAETIKKGVSVPEDRLYKENSERSGMSSMYGENKINGGYYNAADITEEDDLPF